MLKRIKAAYSLYNLFHYKLLKHNEILFKKIGLKKFYFSSISSKDFKGINPDLLNFNFQSKPINETKIFDYLSENSKQSLQNFEENGYAVIDNFLGSTHVEKVNQEIDDLLFRNEIRFKNTNKLMFAFHKSELIKQIATSEKLTELLTQLLKGEPILFQSINFITPSQQKAHSDALHMTTFPLGGLIAIWIALEDIDEQNGALHYYPKSHKLPYYLNSDYKNDGNFLFNGRYSYGAYEDFIEQKIQENKLEKKIFRAKKGDAIIWHSNLLHGGEPLVQSNKTRKSMVFHYFKKGVICYHEITQRPALIKF